MLGTVSSRDLGFTLPHEHLFLDMWSWPGGKTSVGLMGMFDADLDWGMMVEEVSAFEKLGGVTMVEVSLEEIGRNPHALKKLSLETGIHIAMGCGWYCESYHPQYILSSSIDELSERLIDEIENGVESSGIRPGIIGEVGFEGEKPTEGEEWVLRAAARAHQRTGLAITTHTNMRRSGSIALDILMQEGVPPDRIVIGHLDCYPVYGYLADLLGKGCYVQFDCVAFYFEPSFGMPRDGSEMAYLTVGLIEEGFSNQILLSHDICHRSLLRHYGGPGYVALVDRFIPLLQERGMGQQDIETITIGNPGRVLSHEVQADVDTGTVERTVLAKSAI